MSSSRIKTYAAISVGTTAAALFAGSEGGVTTLVFSAPSTNTDPIYIGDSDVDASVGRGIKLSPNTSFALSSDSGRGGGSQLLALNSFWADSTGAAQSLSITAIATD